MDYDAAIDGLPNELHPYVGFIDHELWIGHPLVRMSLQHYPLDQVVARYVEKRSLAARARTEGDHGTFIRLHERPHRVSALLKCHVHGREFWELVAWVWMDTESVRYDRAKWESVWMRREPERHTVMSEEERAELATLPETFIIWRGVETRHKRTIEGLSWSLSREIAERFAVRFTGKGYLIEGRVRRDDVFALLNGRKEKEIVTLTVSNKNITQHISVASKVPTE
jgi:hypothetical protein